jgi:SAM-dependent methyltransferase
MPPISENDALNQWLELFFAAFESGNLHKCTLSRPGVEAAADLKNIYIRPVLLKKGLHLAFNYRYATRDEVHNFLPDAARTLLSELLGKQFLNATALSATHEHILQIDKKGLASLRSVAAQRSNEAPALQHNREKKRLLDPAAPWLQALGICNKAGQVLPSAQDKWKQINKYLETVDSLLREIELPQSPLIADMGSGKGYLTFALYEFLSKNHQLQPRITGIELRQNLVDQCNRIAADNQFEGLNFMAQDIQQYRPEALDMLIALHACDTATDLALAAGVHNQARVIVVAPCCHKQIRRDMDTHNELQPLMRFGILEERQAELLTDGIRALLLESEGYKTKVFEFVSTEHTPKNVMITAVQQGKSEAQKSAAREKVAALKAGFGIGEHFLEKLL